MTEAADSFHQYRRLLADAVDVEVREEPGRTLMIHRIGPDLAIPRASSDYVLTVFVRLARHLIGDSLRLIEVHTTVDKPSDPEQLAVYSRVFGAPILFGMNHNGVVFGHSPNLPLPSADPDLKRLLRRHADALLARLSDDPTTMSGRVRERLVEALPRRSATSEKIASALGLSPRNMRRRLREEGTSFREVLYRLRLGLARQLLDDPNLTIGEISYQLGFSEPSAFHRAFKRWHGSTPNDYRKPTAGG